MPTLVVGMYGNTGKQDMPTTSVGMSPIGFVGMAPIGFVGMAPIGFQANVQ